MFTHIDALPEKKFSTSFFLNLNDTHSLFLVTLNVNRTFFCLPKIPQVPFKLENNLQVTPGTQYYRIHAQDIIMDIGIVSDHHGIFETLQDLNLTKVGSEKDVSNTQMLTSQV